MRTTRDLSAAKRIAYQLLKFRARSEREIRDRLKQKGFPLGIIQQTIDYLYKLKYLNDGEFALAWTNSRILKPLGLRRIAFELKQKGIAPEVIEETFNGLKGKYQEYDTVMELAKNKFKKMKDIEEYKAKQRIFSFLTRRGFKLDTINEVMDNL
ncbi:MAG: regulatory protein RecX [Candidatus Omnitrophota bacterium]|nr:regulatory protein RecX [Candidatus Omnitrophota bacterium]